jgi:cobalt-zinc-cadmium efflux system outer membrane protein
MAGWRERVVRGMRQSLVGTGMLALLGPAGVLAQQGAMPGNAPPGGTSPEPRAGSPAHAAAEAAGVSGAPRVLTLEEALRLALEHNLALQAKEQEMRAVQANEVTAGLIPNPTLSPGVSNAFAPNIGPPQYQLTIAQPIELSGKRQRRIESAEAGSRAAVFDVEDLRRLLTLQVKQAFTAILVAKASAEQTQLNLKTLDELERLQRLRAEKGDLSELDLLRIQQQRFQFESDAADAQQALRIAKVNLRQSIGQDVVDEDFDVGGKFALNEVGVPREELLRQAETRRADLKSARATLEKARADNRLAQAYAVPNIAPTVGVCWADNNSCYGFVVGFSMDLPLFNRNQGEIQRTARDAERVGALTNFALTQTRADVEAALSQLENARIKLKALREVYVPKATEIRARVELAYRRGAASLLEFLDAERTYRAMTLAYISSQGNYDLAVYQLEAAVGGALP